MQNQPRCDVLVIGGGPAGAAAALRASMHGLKVLVLEQGGHPRFHVGESFLPRNMRLIQELGLEERVKTIPQTRKLGASFALGHETGPTDFYFGDGLVDVSPETFNIERAPFDRLLIDCARQAGAEIIENCKVKSIERLADGEVILKLQNGTDGDTIVRGRYLVDASGQSTVIGRHLKTRRTLPDLMKVAYFGHFRNVDRYTGLRAGFPLVVMCREGWFWFIPLDDTRTSVGLVMEKGLADKVGVPAKNMLEWGLKRCPITRQKTENADCSENNGVTADFSYTCRPYAGDGYYLTGDAAMFVDPIFSTGVCLAMMSAVQAADSIKGVLDGSLGPGRARRNYCDYLEAGSSVFFRLVRSFYSHSFREVFLHGTGPFDVHRAVISVLCGEVFPRPKFSLRWRLQLFHHVIRLQRRMAMVPRRAQYSLVENKTVMV